MAEHETTVTDQVRFGLDGIDPSRTVAVLLRDLLFAYKLLGELFMFFRSPANYPDVEAVRRFMGSEGEGALQLLREAYYDRLWGAFPDDIDAALTDHSLQCSVHPPYYRP